MKSVLESAKKVNRWYIGRFHGSMRTPTYSKDTARRVATSADPVRYASMGLALETIDREQVPGAFAELGVWRGFTSSFIHSQAAHRPLYLFDTFNGFPGSDGTDERFRDTSVDGVRQRIGDCSNVIFRVGRFPETAQGLESELFAFVVIDVDKYEPTRAGLEFFYPRISRGGYVFVHDYNSPESEYGVSRAVREYLKGKPEQVVEIPDVYGSVVFRKV